MHLAFVVAFPISNKMSQFIGLFHSRILQGKLDDKENNHDGFLYLTILVNNPTVGHSTRIDNDVFARDAGMKTFNRFIKRYEHKLFY